MGSFWRLIFHILIQILHLRLKTKKRKELTKKMIFEEAKVLEKDTQQMKEVEELLQVRFDCRNAKIEIFHSAVRFTMLWKSLEFPG